MGEEMEDVTMTTPITTPGSSESDDDNMETLPIESRIETKSESDMEGELEINTEPVSETKEDVVEEVELTEVVEEEDNELVTEASPRQFLDGSNNGWFLFPQSSLTPLYQSNQYYPAYQAKSPVYSFQFAYPGKWAAQPSENEVNTHSLYSYNYNLPFSYPYVYYKNLNVESAQDNQV